MLTFFLASPISGVGMLLPSLPSFCWVPHVLFQSSSLSPLHLSFLHPFLFISLSLLFPLCPPTMSLPACQPLLVNIAGFCFCKDVSPRSWVNLWVSEGRRMVSRYSRRTRVVFPSLVQWLQVSGKGWVAYIALTSGRRHVWFQMQRLYLLGAGWKLNTLYFTKALLRWLDEWQGSYLCPQGPAPSGEPVSGQVSTGVPRGSPKVEVFLVGHGTSASEFVICSLHILGGCPISDTSRSIGGALASATFV